MKKSILGNRWELTASREHDNDSLFDIIKNSRAKRDMQEAEIIHDPFLLHDMEKGCERIERAIADHERIIVFGDYDVDGVTATTCLVRTLKKLGAEVSYRIPHRIKEGYSLKEYHIDEIKAAGVKVIITVDNGISAAREIAYAGGQDIDIVVTDHHTPPAKEDIPQAYAIINPKMEDCPYPYKELSGSAVAMKLCIALYSRKYGHASLQDPFIQKLYQIAGIGIVADCMKITGENKEIVKVALQSLNTEPLRGLRSLFKFAGIEGRPYTAQDIAFYLAPRLNAAGRMDSALHALSVFLNQEDSVEGTAKLLHSLNMERKSMTEDFFEEAVAQVEEQDVLPHIIIVASERWNSGINGLVASRLVGKYHRPAIVMAIQDGRCVASCRSIEGFNMVEALTSVEDILEHFGGHHGAAGCSFLEEHFFEFFQRMQNHAEIMLHDYDFVRVLRVDTEIFAHELQMKTLHELQDLAPFGIGNPVPLFLLKNAHIDHMKTIGQDGLHLSCTIGGVRAIAFSAGPYISQLQPTMDVVISMEKNIWQGNEYLQLHLHDFDYIVQKKKAEVLV